MPKHGGKRGPEYNRYPGGQANPWGWSDSQTRTETYTDKPPYIRVYKDDFDYAHRELPEGAGAKGGPPLKKPGSHPRGLKDLP